MNGIGKVQEGRNGQKEQEISITDEHCERGRI